ncbi:MAG: dihydropteroate synthase [Bacteroidia bacterium]
MQDNPQYQNVTLEVLQYFGNRIALCREMGIKDLIIDPGFGFGKILSIILRCCEN